MRSPEIQRRLVDHMPLLGALKGFDKIAQGPLSDQEVRPSQSTALL
jgi:hypothetical protein